MSGLGLSPGRSPPAPRKGQGGKRAGRCGRYLVQAALLRQYLLLAPAPGQHQASKLEAPQPRVRARTHFFVKGQEGSEGKGRKGGLV